VYPILFSFGFLTIYSYGTMIALGYLLASFLLWRDVKKENKNPSVYLDLGIGLMVAALLGGRLFYILLHLDFYGSNPLEVLRVDHGGLISYGGLLGAFLWGLFFIRRKNLPFWETLDRMVPYAVLVHAWGRIGCFLNGCCYGKPTGFWTGVVFLGDIIPRHPTQLYESFFLFLLFVVLRGLQYRTLQKGTVFLLYLLCYGLFRWGVEFLRGDQALFLWGWTLPQYLSFLMLGIPIICWRKRKNERSL